MPKLVLHTRPYVKFDVTNRTHRWWLAEFLRTSAWTHCPVLFELETAYGEMIPTMIRQMAEYYTDKQFAKRRGGI